jgi:surface polysaccharide O-acyltransferase-like enzyme
MHGNSCSIRPFYQTERRARQTSTSLLYLAVKITAQLLRLFVIFDLDRFLGLQKHSVSSLAALASHIFGHYFKHHHISFRLRGKSSDRPSGLLLPLLGSYITTHVGPEPRVPCL